MMSLYYIANLSIMMSDVIALTLVTTLRGVMGAEARLLIVITEIYAGVSVVARSMH